MNSRLLSADSTAPGPAGNLHNTSAPETSAGEWTTWAVPTEHLITAGQQLGIRTSLGSSQHILPQVASCCPAHLQGCPPAPEGFPHLLLVLHCPVRQQLHHQRPREAAPLQTLCCCSWSGCARLPLAAQRCLPCLGPPRCCSCSGGHLPGLESCRGPGALGQSVQRLTHMSPKIGEASKALQAQYCRQGRPGRQSTAGGSGDMQQQAASKAFD